MDGKPTRNWILAAVAMAALGFAAYRFFAKSSASAQLPSEYGFDGVCLVCESEGPASASMRTRPPLTCAKCGKQALYPWLFCPDCKHRFVPRLVKRADGPPSFPIGPACTNCGGMHGLAWFPDDPEQVPVGDAPLPAMP